MIPEIKSLILGYAREMEALEHMLRRCREKYSFLDGVEFEVLDDVVRLACLSLVELEAATIQFQDSRCGCHLMRNVGVWVYTPMITEERKLTVGVLLDFVRESGLLCQHERMSGFVMCEDSVTIIVNNAGETPATTETQSS